MRSRTRFAVWSVVALVAFLVVGLAVTAERERIAGSATATAPAKLSARALADLGELTDLKLSGNLYTADGIALRVDIVALSTQDTTATVADPSGGVAEFLVTKDTASVKANRAWWLNTIPSFAQTLTDKWVRADDEMGFPVEMLRATTGDRLARLIADRTEYLPWTATPIVHHDGTPALALTTDDEPWTILVAADDGARLLGISGPLAETTRRLHGSAPSTAYPFGELSTSPVDDPCAKNTKKKLEESRAGAQTAPAPPPMPSATRGPRGRVQVAPAAGCTNTPMCSSTVTVSNIGDETLVGTLTVSSSSGGGGVAAVAVPPGGSVPNTFQVVNPAARCTTTCSVPFTVTAFVQVTSMAGPNLDAGKRLNDRGVDPNRPVPAEPKLTGPETTGLMDDLTNGVTAPSGLVLDDPLVDAVRELLVNALSGRITSLLRDISANPGVQRPPVLSDHPAVQLALLAIDGKTADLRAAGAPSLQLLLDLAVQPGRAPGTLTVRHNVIIDNQDGKAYSLAAAAGDHRTKAERKSPHPDGEADERLYRELQRAIDQFTAAKLDPGVARNVRLAVDPLTKGFGNIPYADLIVLLGGSVNGKPFRDLLVDPAGKLRLDELSITNGRTRTMPAGSDQNRRYVFSTEDLLALTKQTDPNTPPTTKPTEKSLKHTELNDRHILTGDAYDPGDPKRTQDSGGHLAGAGMPGKTEFPSAWTAEDVKEAIRQVVRAGNTVNPSGSSASAPNDGGNHMGVFEWVWRFRDTVTIKGATVELEVFVYDDGTVRTAYPTAKNPIGAPTDPLAVFVNPTAPPAPPGLKPTDVPRYRRPTVQGQPGTWQYAGVDANKQPETVTTDEQGTVLSPPPPPPPTQRQNEDDCK